MKIGFVIDDGLDSTDGVQQYVLTLGEWLRSQGHQVHYLSGQTTRTDITGLHSLARNITVRSNQNRLSIPIYAKVHEIKQLLASVQFDVLHVQMPYSPIFAGRVIASAPKTAAIVGTFHILPYGRVQATGASALAWLCRRTIKKIDAVVAVSSAAQDFAKESMNITSSVVPNAVDLGRFNTGKSMPGLSNGKQTVVFLGRLVERKGCLELLRAVKVLVDQQKFVNRRLVICGDGPLRHRIESYISQNALDDYVHLTGRITEDEKPNYLASADLAVFPSMGGESFGIVLVEAIAAGAKVVLGGDNPGYRTVLDGQSDTLVDPRDYATFAKRIDQLLSDKSLSDALGDLQRQHIRKYDVSVVGQQILEVYQSAIAIHQKNVDIAPAKQIH